MSGKLLLFKLRTSCTTSRNISAVCPQGVSIQEHPSTLLGLTSAELNVLQLQQAFSVLGLLQGGLAATLKGAAACLGQQRFLQPAER